MTVVEGAFGVGARRAAGAVAEDDVVGAGRRAGAPVVVVDEVPADAAAGAVVVVGAAVVSVTIERNVVDKGVDASSDPPRLQPAAARIAAPRNRREKGR